MEPNNLPPVNEPVLDDEPGHPLPPDHAERCRRMAQDMANVERLLYRLANGDKDAAHQLQGLAAHVQYEGAVIRWNIDKLLGNVLE